MTKRNLLLSSRNKLFREGLKHILENQTFNVVAELSSLTEAVTFLRSADDKVDLIVCDTLSEAEESFLELQNLAIEFPTIGIVILTDNLSRSSLDLAVNGGARGFLPKDISPAALRTSLELVLLGENIFTAPASLSGGGSDIPQIYAKPNAPELRVPLSARETQILRCLEAGQPNKVIARNLDMAEATVKVHLKKVLRKINVQNRTQAAIWAMNYMPSSGQGRPQFSV